MLGATVLCYFTLYGPQPLLPIFGAQYGLSPAGAGLIVTVAMIPLTIGPVLSGALLSFAAPGRVMSFALLMLSAAIVVFIVADRYPVVLAARLVQGMMFPLILTTVTAQIAAASPAGSVGRRLGYYVAATIVGGFGGRLLSSAFAALGDWRWFFAIVAAGALGVGVWVARWDVVPSAAGRPRGRAGDLPASPVATPAAARPMPIRIFAGVFVLFCVFSGTLNVLPFRVIGLIGTRSEWLSGVIYAGYAMGIVSSIGSHRIVRVSGGRPRALAAAYLVLAASIALMLVNSVGVLFGALFLFCGAMFLIHSVATGAANQHASGREGAVNGLYISSYYTGGVIGTYLAPLVYEVLGWAALTLIALVLTAFGALLVIGAVPAGVPTAGRPLTGDYGNRSAPADPR